MSLLLIALALIWVTWIAESKGLSQIDRYSRIAFFAVLIVWLWVSADLPKLGNGEEGLLLWFAYGLGAAVVGELLQQFKLWMPWSYVAFPLTALLFAMGLDVFRPNAYAYAPAAVLTIMVSLVAARLAQRLIPNMKNRGWSVNLVAMMLYTLSVAIMLFAAFFKLMDRNWLLPWSYLLASGALLWALSQLWIAWEMVRGIRVVQPRNSLAAYQLGSLLIVVAAFFHYQQYF